MTAAEMTDVDTSVAAAARPTCAALYEEHFEFVWRNARRLGIAESACEDVVHEVFLVVQRRLADFEGRSSARTWLYGILARVAAEQRRRDGQRLCKESVAVAERLLGEGGQSADDDLARKEATGIVDEILTDMDEEKRTIFVLVELEEVSVPAAARGLAINLNTAYARLRAARVFFAEAVKRVHAKSSHDETQRHWWRRH